MNTVDLKLSPNLERLNEYGLFEELMASYPPELVYDCLKEISAIDKIQLYHTIYVNKRQYTSAIVENNNFRNAHFKMAKNGVIIAVAATAAYLFNPSYWEGYLSWLMSQQSLLVGLATGALGVIALTGNNLINIAWSYWNQFDNSVKEAQERSGDAIEGIERGEYVNEVDLKPKVVLSEKGKHVFKGRVGLGRKVLKEMEVEAEEKDKKVKKK